MDDEDHEAPAPSSLRQSSHLASDTSSAKGTAIDRTAPSVAAHSGSCKVEAAAPLLTPEHDHGLESKTSRKRKLDASTLYPTCEATPQKRNTASVSGTGDTSNELRVPPSTSFDVTSSLSSFDPNFALHHWLTTLHWPKNHLIKKGIMPIPLPRTKSSASLKRSYSAATTPSDQRPREEKSKPYNDPRYETLLNTQGRSYMQDSAAGPSAESKKFCHTLLTEKTPLPSGTLFDDEVFDNTIQSIRTRNEPRIIVDINRLIVPSAESFAACRVISQDLLIENVNEGWNNSLPITGPRPQSDYSVGFTESAFGRQHVEKVRALVGGVDYLSYFAATYKCFFPFFACEVKSGAVGLEIADRQNAHSMTMAVRGVVELYRAVERQNELHREILAFSVSHDHSCAKIYGHYADIDGDETTYYRHQLRRFDFTELAGKEKWTAYTFTLNVYKIWMPMHLKRIISALDSLPDQILPGPLDTSDSQLASTPA